MITMKFNIWFILGLMYLTALFTMFTIKVGTFHPTFFTEPMDPYYVLIVFGLPFVLGYLGRDKSK